MSSPTSTSFESTVNADWLRLVREKVESLRYGVVVLTVHDGKVTQIERTEKTRIEARSR